MDHAMKSSKKCIKGIQPFLNLFFKFTSNVFYKQLYFKINLVLTNVNVTKKLLCLINCHYFINYHIFFDYVLTLSF